MRRRITRVVLIRSGVVLERSGGVLPRMMTPFRFFVGGPLGSGRQFWSWIHRIDWIEMIRWIVDTPSISGPVNTTAPVPVTNREFARALGRGMRRPALVPAPAFALKLILGEMATPLVLRGQRGAVRADTLEELQDLLAQPWSPDEVAESEDDRAMLSHAEREVKRIASEFRGHRKHEDRHRPRHEPGRGRNRNRGGGQFRKRRRGR